MSSGESETSEPTRCPLENSPPTIEWHSRRRFRQMPHQSRSPPFGSLKSTQMAMFVHLALESQAKHIQRVGISRLRRPFGKCPGGVFAVPVVRDFSVSHQWLRELKRRNAGPIVGIYFRIPDDDFVWVGHYSNHHCKMNAAESVAIFDAAEDAQGWEVVIPRRIDPKEIHKVRSLPQVIGWRFSPSSKGKRPFCACKFCTRGDYGAQKLRDRLNPDGE